MRANGSLRTDIDVGPVDDTAPKSWEDVKDRFRQVISPRVETVSTSQTEVNNNGSSSEPKN